MTMDRLRTLPRPAPDKVSYEATLDEGFRAYPKRIENYRKYKSAKRTSRVDYLPIRLDVENVSRCNFHCTMCQVSDWPHLQRAADMSFEDYKALLDSQYGLIEIKLQGMGEPLMGKCYFDMIRYARRRHIWVRSTTNASLLHIKDNYKRVIDSDICELQVSIDGATSATYEKIRRGGRFKGVMENCVRLNEYCFSTNRRRTRMWVVVQQDNFQELDLFPALAAELGFDRITLSLDLNDWGQDQWRGINDKVDTHRQFDYELAKRLVDLGKASGVEVTFWFIDEKYDTSAPDKLCPWPFERGYVSSDMRLVACCMIATPQVSDLGDARRLVDTWNDAAMVEFRQAHLEGRIPSYCQGCYQKGTVVKPTTADAAGNNR